MQLTTGALRSAKNRLADYITEKCPTQPFACSFDVRMCHEKSYAVDANFFPAGWHHLPFPEQTTWAKHQQKVKAFFGWKAEEPIAIVPEHHLQNEDYLKNLVWLHNFYTCAGFRTFVVPITETGSIQEKLVIDHVRGPCHGNPLEYCPYDIHEGRMWVEGVPLAFALSQYDGSKSPLNLKDPKTCAPVSLTFYPPHVCNWQVRLKQSFFEAYHRFVAEVTSALDLDLSAFTYHYSSFVLQEGSVMDHWDDVMSWVSRELGQASPGEYFMLKSGHGTYGLGVEPVFVDDGVEAWSLRKIRKFRHGRHGVPIRGLVLQEGLETVIESAGLPAERVDYYFLGDMYGSFYRMHEKKDPRGNLNRKGSQFSNDADVTPEQNLRMDVASLLAFGGICREYESVGL